VDGGLVGCRVVGENVLSDGGEVGFEHPGGYGEYLVTEALRLHVLPSHVSFPAATLIEPLAVCVRGMRRLRFEDRSRALIWGDGPIGLLMTGLLRRAGVAEVVLVGGRPGRLQTALELGASAALNYHALGRDLVEGVSARAGTGFPNIVEASGAAAAVQASLHLAAPGGHLLLLGDYGDARADLAWNRVLHGELELIGSCASEGAWAQAVHLAEGACVSLDRLVTHAVPADRFADGFAWARSHDGSVIKVVLAWAGTVQAA
jgi:threonine dehydrogenase-like Zn-dependent dehydrogenase